MSLGDHVQLLLPQSQLRPHPIAVLCSCCQVSLPVPEEGPEASALQRQPRRPPTSHPAWRNSSNCRRTTSGRWSLPYSVSPRVFASSKCPSVSSTSKS